MNFLQNLTISFNVIFPICFMVLIGYVIQRLKLVPREAFDGCIKLCFQVLIPLHLFMSVGSASLGEVFHVGLILAVVGGVFVFWLLCMFIVPLIEKDDRKKGAIVQGVSRSNFVLFGIPIAQTIAGDTAAAMAAIVVAIVVPLYNVLCVIGFEVFRGGKPNAKRIVSGIVKNPLIISSVLGIVWMLSGLEMPALLKDTLLDISGMATPLAIVGLGGTFRFSAVRNNLRPLTITVVGKLIVQPIFLFAIGWLLGLRGATMAVLLGVATTPPPVSSFPLVQQMGGDGEFGGQIVVLSTLMAFPTIFLWVFTLSSLGWI